MSFWSYEHMDDAMWQAVRQLPGTAAPPLPAPAEGDILQRVGALEGRVSEIERRLAITPPPTARTYAVQPGDTLSGIAQRLGVSWQALHQANRSVIGAAPNFILLGQLLTLP